jgi:hypothetical protein
MLVQYPVMRKRNACLRTPDGVSKARGKGTDRELVKRN